MWILSDMMRRTEEDGEIELAFHKMESRGDTKATEGEIRNDKKYKNEENNKTWKECRIAKEGKILKI